jgi:hypothetical protein
MAAETRTHFFLVEIDGARQEALEVTTTPMTCWERDRQLRAVHPGRRVTVNTADASRRGHFFSKYVNPMPGVPAPLRR